MRFVGYASERGWRRLWVCCWLGLSASGCAQVTVISDQAPPKTEWKFGVLAIDLAPSGKNTIISSSGFGWVATPSGATLGYAKAKIVQLGDQCRLVITTNGSDNAGPDKKLLELLKRAESACGA